MKDWWFRNQFTVDRGKLHFLSLKTVIFHVINWWMHYYIIIQIHIQLLRSYKLLSLYFQTQTLKAMHCILSYFPHVSPSPYSHVMIKDLTGYKRLWKYCTVCVCAKGTVTFFAEFQQADFTFLKLSRYWNSIYYTRKVGK